MAGEGKWIYCSYYDGGGIANLDDMDHLEVRSNELNVIDARHPWLILGYFRGSPAPVVVFDTDTKEDADIALKRIMAVMRGEEDVESLDSILEWTPGGNLS